MLGTRGQLGAATVQEWSTEHETVGLSRAALDVTDDLAIAATLDRVRPEVIVNCAAYNEVDAAEDHPVDALNVNTFAVRAMAQVAEHHGATLVHYSSDFVFDGTATEPYTEEDQPNPRSVYAASKLLGEWFAFDVPRAYVLRVESLFGGVKDGPLPRGSVASIAAGMIAGQSPRVFEDRTVSPTYIIDAARVTRQLVESRAPSGLYHCVNSGHCTWLAFAEELGRQLGPSFVGRLTPVRMADVNLRAERPKFCALSNEKLRHAGIDMPSWQDAVARYVETLRR